MRFAAALASMAAGALCARKRRGARRVVLPYFSAVMRGGNVVIEVWDTGLGIPADKQKAVFREFERLALGLLLLQLLLHLAAVALDLATRRK